MNSINEHPDYRNWSIQQGRFFCFESLKNLMQDIFGADVAFEKRKTPVNRLLKLLKESVQYQYLVAKQTGSMTKFKFDPVSQCSEVSLAKDLISADSLLKFNKANLNEVKIGFYSRKPRPG